MTVIVPMNDLRRGYAAHANEISAAVFRVLESGWYIHGHEHAEFEREFAEFIGAGHCIGVGNGTEALELAIRALELPLGSTIVTAANAAMYATTAICRSGHAVSFADVDEATLLLTADTIERALTSRVAAVIVTHLYGRMARMGPILALCRARGVAVIEDCAQATGARDHVGRAGSLGDVAAFSFYPTKNLGAVGDGGAVTTASDQLADRLRSLRQYGWSSKYVVSYDGGGNSRLDELQAAVLRVRMAYVLGQNAARRSIIARYVDASGNGPVRVLPAIDESHAGHLAVAICANRDAVREHLLARGVRTDIHYPIPDHRQPVLAREFAAVTLPATEAAAETVFSLPCFPELAPDEIDQICDALRSVR
jgi:aminotransferase EvaB